jgi:hypothetical protein
MRVKSLLMSLIPDGEKNKGFANSLVESPIKVLSTVSIAKPKMATNAPWLTKWESYHLKRRVQSGKM